MRCLILGATGLIGSHLTAACDDRGLARLGSWYRSPHPDHVPLDVRDDDGVNELLADYQPDVTFLAAGLACHGYADAYPAECRQVTVDGTKTVAAAVARHGGSLVLFTSDEVFGEARTSCREDDPTTPRGELARGQVKAEALVRAYLPDRHLIVRTSWVYGPEERGRNFGCRLAKKLDAGDRVDAATDRTGQPTYAADLADAALELARAGQTGTVHVAGPDRHTGFTFARLAAHVYGFDSDLVHGCPAAAMGEVEKRSWLDRFKLRGLLGAQAVRGAGDGLRALRAELFPQPAAWARAA